MTSGSAHEPATRDAGDAGDADDRNALAVRRDERLPRARRLRADRDFARARQHGRHVNGKLLALTYAPRTVAPTVGAASPTSVPSRVGFSVSKRVGGAVTRNRVKRRLREIVRRRLSEVAAGWDIIMVARPLAAEATYNALETEVHSLLSRARLWRGDDAH